MEGKWKGYVGMLRDKRIWSGCYHDDGPRPTSPSPLVVECLLLVDRKHRWLFDWLWKVNMWVASIRVMQWYYSKHDADILRATGHPRTDRLCGPWSHCELSDGNTEDVCSFIIWESLVVIRKFDFAYILLNFKIIHKLSLRSPDHHFFFFFNFGCDASSLLCGVSSTCS